jgi:DNA-binding CsgD family transcriptional regulator
MFATKKKIRTWVDCGDDYFYGLDGEERNTGVAAFFYEKAAKKKDHYAAYMLGLCYELGGTRLRKDDKIAVEWYKKAAVLGSEYAQQRLAEGQILIPPSPYEEEPDIKDIVTDKKSDLDSLNLTSRELEIFNLLLPGTAPKEIAYKLNISNPTVNFHISNLYRKLDIQSRAELFAKYGKTPNL